MEEARYDSENLLQKLLADHSDLLAGDQINVDEPRRWLLVTREMTVPGEQDGAGRWSLDHLFLDQDAIPTLVEVSSLWVRSSRRWCLVCWDRQKWLVRRRTQIVENHESG